MSRTLCDRYTAPSKYGIRIFVLLHTRISTPIWRWARTFHSVCSPRQYACYRRTTGNACLVLLFPGPPFMRGGWIPPASCTELEIVCWDKTNNVSVCILRLSYPRLNMSNPSLFHKLTSWILKLFTCRHRESSSRPKTSAPDPVQKHGAMIINEGIGDPVAEYAFNQGQ